MRTEPTARQRLVAGIVGLGIAGALGLWLSMSYFGIWTSDTKVSVVAPEVGDAIGPGAKVRYHGIIVGRVLKLADHGDEYRVQILVDAKHATSIPSTATARILPSTIFGSEYVELLSDHDATGDDHLASGDVLQTDTSEATLRLMNSFDQADRLISAIDVEDINRITGKLAPALDGNGHKIKDFLERADSTVTDLNADLPTVWQTLRLAPDALDTLNDIEPDLVSAMGHTQKTTTTIAERDEQIGRLLDSATTVVNRGNSLVEQNREVLVPFVGRLERLTGLVADNSGSLRSVLTRFGATTNNGAKGIDENAIQMIGTIGTDLLHPYTAADCTKYGPHLVASNCGDAVPAKDASADPDLDAIASRLSALMDERSEKAAKGDTATARAPTPGATTSAPAAAPPGALSDVVDLLSGIGAALGGGR